MKILNNLFQVISVQVSIDLGGGDGFMAQHFLNSAQVGTAFN